MYQIEEIVVEKNSGMSRIIDIREENFGERGWMRYYVLQPFADRGATVYIPVHGGDRKIRSLHTRSELEKNREKAKKKTLPWIDSDKERQQQFIQIVKEGNMEQLFLLIRTIVGKKKELLGKGKKFRAVDERILKDAEFLVYPEVAYIMEIDEREVLDWLFES